MVPSEKAIALIKSCEGCSLTAYQDVVGVWTIGWGHTGVLMYFDTPLDLVEGRTITQPMADWLLVQDLNRVTTHISAFLPAVTQYQFDALSSFAYNLGAAALKGSSLLMHIKMGDFEAAAKEFSKWNHAGGKVVAGLTKRRKLEEDMFRGN